jgi:hypothetical protein
MRLYLFSSSLNHLLPFQGAFSQYPRFIQAESVNCGTGVDGELSCPLMSN